MRASESRVSKTEAQWPLALVPSWKVSLNAYATEGCPPTAEECRWGSQRPGGREPRKDSFAPRRTRSPWAGAGGSGTRLEWPRDSSAGPQGTQGPESTLQTRAPGHLPKDSSTQPDGSPRFLDGQTVKGIPASARPCRLESRHQHKDIRVTANHGDMTSRKKTDRTTDPKKGRAIKSLERRQNDLLKEIQWTIREQTQLNEIQETIHKQQNEEVRKEREHFSKIINPDLEEYSKTLSAESFTDGRVRQKGSDGARRPVPSLTHHREQGKRKRPQQELQENFQRSQELMAGLPREERQTGART